MSQPDAFDIARAQYLAEHPELSPSAVKAQEQRERILNRSTVPADLPDSITCALVGLTFNVGYPANVRKVERALAANYWESPDAPIPFEVDLRNLANEYDANAVEVRDPNFEILGHLPRAVAARLAPEMDDGITWSAVVVSVRTHPDNPNNPGVDVRLTRGAMIPTGTATIDDVIAESVGEMSLSEVEWELATRSLPVPPADEMRSALIEVYRSERAEKMREGEATEPPEPRYLGEGEWSDGI